jgi:uncharacterized protein
MSQIADVNRKAEFDVVDETASPLLNPRIQGLLTPSTTERSCLYVGTIRHRRVSPKKHDFSYRLFMVLVDLGEIDEVFRVPFVCSTRRFSLVQFRRSDYFGDPSRPLDKCIRELVQERLGVEVRGPIQLLTHLRYFGISFNPVSFYYCFEEDGETLQAIVAEVSNTPWREKHCYVVPCKRGQRNHQHECAKEFHVSPFMQMNMTYRWHLTNPSDRLTAHIENHDSTGRVFDATLQLQRRPLTTSSLVRTIFRFPWMTMQVFLLIYWQALRLWWKKIPFVPHPKH